MATKADIKRVTDMAEDQAFALLRKGKGYERRVAHIRDCLNAARNADYKGTAWQELQAAVGQPVTQPAPTPPVVEESLAAVTASASGSVGRSE